MRKIAKKRQNFAVKKCNFFVLDPIMLKFKLDLDNIDGLFPIDFQHPRTKNSKVTLFFTKSGYFCDISACILYWVKK